ncbi:hypothetical protein CRG98_040633 [Punica granatum]|uniref:Uncharacterized protein n=1 Tax=Punica granatum TaxID=22663 RepID=A0A2I0I4U1_PUNGR|nr:hypothetical protein CRG98_040633 [Punica granatum]
MSLGAFWAAALKCSEGATDPEPRVSRQQDQHSTCFGITNKDTRPHPPIDGDILPKESENVEVANNGSAFKLLSCSHRKDDVAENTEEDPVMDFDIGDVCLSDLLDADLTGSSSSSSPPFSDPQPAISSEELMLQDWNLIIDSHQADNVWAPNHIVQYSSSSYIFDSPEVELLWERSGLGFIFLTQNLLPLPENPSSLFLSQKLEHRHARRSQLPSTTTTIASLLAAGLDLMTHNARHGSRIGLDSLAIATAWPRASTQSIPSLLSVSPVFVSISSLQLFDSCDSRPAAARLLSSWKAAVTGRHGGARVFRREGVEPPIGDPEPSTEAPIPTEDAGDLGGGVRGSSVDSGSGSPRAPIPTEDAGALGGGDPDPKLTRDFNSGFSIDSGLELPIGDLDPDPSTEVVDVLYGGQRSR